jgi:NAD(P)H-dependent FMN reductase
MARQASTPQLDIAKTTWDFVAANLTVTTSTRKSAPMNIVVLNGSPKGEVSVTMQYVAYLKKKFPGHAFEVFDVAREVSRLEREPAAWDALQDRLREAQLVLWAFPVYFLSVPSQYKRFIELLLER